MQYESKIIKNTEVLKMYGIALVTYAEAKEMCRYISIDGEIFDIEEDVYGLVLNNKFIPVKLDGIDEYLRAGVVD
jgi:hypothetical protein